MKRKGTLGTTAAVIGAATIAIAVGATAGGAAVGSTGYEFVGWAGGSLVRAANNTITSDLTAASSINNEGLVSDSNSAAAVSVPNLLNTGVVKTSTASTAIDGGYQVESRAETANVSALGGLITADAIDTVSTVKVVDGVASSSVKTTLVNLKVGTIRVPLTVAPNTIIRIPNIATVALNYQLSSAKAGTGYTIGIGAYVSLLKPRGDNAIGAELAISPTTSQVAPVVVPPSGHFLYANAYGSQVKAQIGSLVGIQSDPTAPISMPAAGTDGLWRTSQITGVHLDPAAAVGVITDSVYGTNTSTSYDARATSKVASVNLLGGLIKADAVTSSARVSGLAALGVPLVVTGDSTLLNLSINGSAIPVTASPNTTINLLNIAIVTINQQIKTSHSMIVRALDIKLTTAAYGFPAGAEIQVAAVRASAS